MILIYTPEFSNRLIYTLQFIFEEQLDVEYSIVYDTQVFRAHAGPKINYSDVRISSDELFMKSHILLSERNIKPFSIKVKKDAGLVKFFLQEDSDIDFDVFSACFYLLSRYEEYLPFKKDKHGRFEADQSLAFKEGFIDEPVVDQWVQFLKQKLQQKFPALLIPEKKFIFQPTIDIDQFFSIQEKSFVRFMKPVLLAMLKFDLRKLLYLFKVRFDFLKDPFDQTEKMEELHRKYDYTAIYFFLFAQKYNSYDINISVKNKTFKKRIKLLSSTASIGIHPSFQSRMSSRIVEQEMDSLVNVINQSIYSSRQHFLKSKMPNTFKSLISMGIRDEYTMGYASALGFRAGTSNSFKFYDLRHEQLTFLNIHPFCVMDASFTAYLKYTPEQALDSIKKIMDKVKRVNGTFIPLWHNESLSGMGVWKGWEDVYEKMLILSKDNS